MAYDPVTFPLAMTPRQIQGTLCGVMSAARVKITVGAACCTCWRRSLRDIVAPRFAAPPALAHWALRGATPPPSPASPHDPRRFTLLVVALPPTLEETLAQCLASSELRIQLPKFSSMIEG